MIVARWRRALNLLVFAVAAGGVVFFTVHTVALFIAPHAGDVDFADFHTAARNLNAGHNIYPPALPCCFRAYSGYAYPPLLAELLRPAGGMRVDDAGRVWLAVSTLALMAAVAVYHRSVGRMLRPRTEVMLLAALLLFPPLYAGLHGLQVATVLLFVETTAAAALVAMPKGATAPVALAIGTALKVSPSLLIPALLTGGRRSALRAIVIFAVALLAILGALWVLVPETPSYFLDVLPRFSGGTIAPWNRSLPGVILRTLDATGIQPWQRFAVITTLMEAGMLAVTWHATRGAGASPRARAATFAAFVAAMPITQGVTWDHHLLPSMLAIALLAPSVRAGGTAWWLMVASYPLLSVNQLRVDPVLGWAGLDHPHGIGVVVYVAVISINLAGMLLLWLASLRVLAELRNTRAGPTTP